ncbi:hypothetical protein AAK913_13270 [Enterococcus faecium]|uniref:hypothetical protein n=1 Tax=Enterococcus TaxID=1350 RepID=UPI0010947674|nr:hypothetical protein [Enterococcus hirae]MCR1913782.1 hypothetical protein [Enterococcus hirae]QQU12369.1 hypothetical protein I6I82_00645 [Enterococcus hirae]TGY21263.1 hypothetical protein E5348_14295 [Enterococcus hirae]
MLKVTLVCSILLFCEQIVSSASMLLVNDYQTNIEIKKNISMDRIKNINNKPLNIYIIENSYKNREYQLTHVNSQYIEEKILISKRKSITQLEIWNKKRQYLLRRILLVIYCLFKHNTHKNISSPNNLNNNIVYLIERRIKYLKISD